MTHNGSTPMTARSIQQVRDIAHGYRDAWQATYEELAECPVSDLDEATRASYMAEAWHTIVAVIDGFPS